MVSDSQMMDVAPGETIEIKTAFVLKDMTSEVEIRFEELIGDKSASLTIAVYAQKGNARRQHGDVCRGRQRSDCGRQQHCRFR